MNVDDFQTIGQVIDRARDVVDPGVHAWAASGAGEGVTLARNVVALNSLALVPRVMMDVSDVDISTAVVGIPLALPVFLAPVAALELYDSGDSLAAGQAAAQVSTSAICATLASSSWEEVAASGHHLFQMYVFGDRQWMAEVLRRVETAGFEGVCVTVDTPALARRDASLVAGFTWDVHSTGAPNLVQHGSDPSYRGRFTWDELRWLCEETDLPVIVKGILTPQDAAASVECGVAGVYVSNHGGRVLDHSVSAIEVLADVVDAVGPTIDVVVDGGFTRGAEVCKALALGARAVGIGKLQCWGLAVGGTEGMVRVLEILRDEIAITMANVGAKTVEDLTPNHVTWSAPAWPGKQG